MANGDAATAAGMDTVDATADRRMGYDEINKTRDYIVQRRRRADAGEEIVPVAVAGATVTVPVVFSDGEFTEPPIVTATPANSRLTPQYADITTAGCTIRLTNWTNGTANAAAVGWIAMQRTAG